MPKIFNTDRGRITLNVDWHDIRKVVPTDAEHSIIFFVDGTNEKVRHRVDEVNSILDNGGTD